MEAYQMANIYRSLEELIGNTPLLEIRYRYKVK